MGGINSLSGLNTMNVDFRPTIQVNEQKPSDENRLLPEADVAPGEAQPPQKAEVRSIVQKLDVLLLNAAGKSVFKSTEKRMDAIGKSLVENGVISEKDKAKLVNLAKDASSKLAALDKFSGREIAKALMVDKKSEHGELVWGKGFFGLNATAKAVKAAVEAQQKLSEELAKLNDSLIGNKGVNPAFQDAFMELQFQCDRRSTEIYSVAVRMHDLVQQDVVNGTDADPQVAAYLDATFKELMPREAILMHGTNWKTEYEQRVKNDPAIVRNGNTLTIDLTKAGSHEAKMAIIQTLGLQSLALPEEIDKEFYDKLMEMADPAKKQAYLDSIKSRVSPEALEATSKRIDEAIAYAQKLNAGGKVYGKEQWREWNNIVAMPGVKATVTITKTNNTKIKAENDIECVRQYNDRKCPSFFKREFLHKMFDKPQMAA